MWLNLFVSLYLSLSIYDKSTTRQPKDNHKIEQKQNKNKTKQDQKLAPNP
jgi:hypothetical protein